MEAITIISIVARKIRMDDRLFGGDAASRVVDEKRVEEVESSVI
jgi:hypothetical protein